MAPMGDGSGGDVGSGSGSGSGSGGKRVGRNPLGGAAAVADMLNLMDRETREKILSNVAAKDAETAARIEEHLMTFEHLALLERADLQILLREVPQSKLALALRSASDPIKEAIFSNLSARAGQLLREEIEGLGPRRVSDIEAAQKLIVEAARRLDSQGKIRLARR